MPELPEVETVRIGLARLLPGRQLKAADYDWPKSFPNAPADVQLYLVGAKFLAVKRRAKVLLIELSTEYSLIIHLKMTGQLVFRGAGEQGARELVSPNPRGVSKSAIRDSGRTPNAGERFGAGHPNASLVGELPDKSTRVTLTFTDGSRLFFNDQRKFGWMRLLPTLEVMQLDFFQKVGPEPLAADFTWQAMRARLLRRKNSNIKAVLLDQTVIAGIGNIYADEALWGAQIHPLTPVNKLTDDQFRTLYEELIMVLKLAIEKGGSTDKNYVSAQVKQGKKAKHGSYLSFARVFRREGQPCPRCGTTIIKTRVAGRGTHLCSKCQTV
jgi:formamidopyrimidine-DNA glycosylase